MKWRKENGGILSFLLHFGIGYGSLFTQDSPASGQLFRLLSDFLAGFWKARVKVRHHIIRKVEKNNSTGGSLTTQHRNAILNIR